MSDKFWIIDNGSESYLSHHGIKGQKWGKENGPPYPLGSDISTGKTLKKQFKSKKVEKGKTLKTKNNNLSVTESKWVKGSYNVYDSNNKKVGSIIIDDEGDNDHIDWLGVKESERRKGYGKDILDAIIEDSTAKGKKSITLDAAGLDPAAKHIYESRGFKEIEKRDSDIWNGLTIMKKDLSPSAIKNPVTGKEIPKPKNLKPKELDKQIKKKK